MDVPSSSPLFGVPWLSSPFGGWAEKKSVTPRFTKEMWVRNFTVETQEVHRSVNSVSETRSWCPSLDSLGLANYSHRLFMWIKRSLGHPPGFVHVHTTAMLLGRGSCDRDCMTLNPKILLI